MRKTLVFIYLSKRIKKAIKNDRPYYIITTWIEQRSFSAGDTYKDSYFGRLPAYLRQEGKEFIIVGGILREYRDLVRKIKRVNQILIIPQEYFVGYLDYLMVIMLNFVNRLKIIKPAEFCGLEVTDLVRESLKKDYENNEINKNLIYYYYVKGLLKRLKVQLARR